MDRTPEELQSLGFYGICREAYDIIASKRKIFSQITLAFILPLSFIYLAQIEFSDLLYSTYDSARLKTRLGSRIQDRFISETFVFWLFVILHHIVFLFLSLFPTSALAYTIARAYTTKEITFNQVTTVVPTIWKRLMETLVWSFLIMVVYHTFTIPILCFAGLAAGFVGNARCKIFFVIVIIIYMTGLAFIGGMCQLASVVSVLEESYGYNAFLKSKALIEGMPWIASVIFLKLQISFVVVLIAFDNLVAHGSVGIMSKVTLGILCLLMLSLLIQFALVTQTVVYFVCKSYHRENIE